MFILTLDLPVINGSTPPPEPLREKTIYPANGITIDPNTREKVYPKLGEDLGPNGCRFDSSVGRAQVEAQRLFFAEKEARDAFFALRDKVKLNQPVKDNEVLFVACKLARADKEPFAKKLIETLFHNGNPDWAAKRTGNILVLVEEAKYTDNTLALVEEIDKEFSK